MLTNLCTRKLFGQSILRIEFTSLEQRQSVFFDPFHSLHSVQNSHQVFDLLDLVAGSSVAVCEGDLPLIVTVRQLLDKRLKEIGVFVVEKSLRKALQKDIKFNNYHFLHSLINFAIYI